MVNAIKLASALVDSIPKDRWSPETTSHREGFVHPVSIEGGLEKATVQFIIRDHETSKLAEYENELERLANQVIQNNPGASFTSEITEQYRNMKEILKDVPFVTDYAVQAMEKVGITPKRAIIRGGTDGSRLSFMGLPCPNIFTGGYNFHGIHEFITIEGMEAAVQVIVKLAEKTALHYRQ